MLFSHFFGIYQISNFFPRKINIAQDFDYLVENSSYRTKFLVIFGGKSLGKYR